MKIDRVLWSGLVPFWRNERGAIASPKIEEKKIKMDLEKIDKTKILDPLDFLGLDLDF